MKKNNFSLTNEKKYTIKQMKRALQTADLGNCRSDRTALSKRIINLFFAGSIIVISFFPTLSYTSIGDKNQSDSPQLIGNVRNYNIDKQKRINFGQKRKKEGNASTPQDQLSEDSAEFQAFISGMFCSGCSRHCPLTNLQCSRGQKHYKKALTSFMSQQTDSANSENELNFQNDNQSTLDNIMTYAPLGGLAVGGIYFGSNHLIKKRGQS